MKSSKKEIPKEQHEELLKLLKNRFEKSMKRHPDLEWTKIQSRLETSPDKLWSLKEMEESGGEPDVIGYDDNTDTYLFCDCSVESPKGRRNLCYDRAAQLGRKENSPQNNALDMADAMGIEILNEELYRKMQKLGEFDTKTSSWIQTPADIRKKGGAIFADRRYGKVFVYHNGASSYYAARGFRGSLTV